MKAIMLMFDSLNRRFLQPYGSPWSETPNFKRLAQKSVTFNRCYVGSMPCIPTRRELHTGRHNFLHRSWGPLEPFDDSMPELLKKAGVYTHLVTDHKHYWRDGGATYHNRYSTYEFIRGQAGDLWIGQVEKPPVKVNIQDDPEKISRRMASRSQDKVNRTYLEEHNQHQLIQTLDKGLEFIDRNIDADQWFLQIECFDPHEPYFVTEEYKQKYHCDDEFDGWAPFIIRDHQDGDPDTIRTHYQALLAMVDAQLGRLLDKMDEHNLWEDTLLIVNTDHGVFLGEHDWWYMSVMPLYNEMANIPLFIYDPRYRKQGLTSDALVQTIDLPATLLDYFNISKPKDFMGSSLSQPLQGHQEHRQYALFGYFGCSINITNGEFVYHRAPITKNYQSLHEYTLIPTHINRPFSVDELRKAKLHPPFSFTKGCSVLQIPATDQQQPNYHRYGSRLYNVIHDPDQQFPIQDDTLELYFCKQLTRLLKENDAPDELYEYYGLSEDMNLEILLEQRRNHYHEFEVLLKGLEFENRSCIEGWLVLVSFINLNEQSQFQQQSLQGVVDEKRLSELLEQWISPSQFQQVRYIMDLNMKIH